MPQQLLRGMALSFMIFLKYAYFSILLLLLLLQDWRPHNQILTYEHLLKDKFAYFTSFANEGYSYM